LKQTLLDLLSWYGNLVGTSWKRELKRIRGKKDDKWIWVGLCIVFTFILMPYLTIEAFKDSFLLGISFIWASLVAISFGYILKIQ